MRRSLEETAAVLEKVLAKEIKVTIAARRLSLSAKQTGRLAKRYAKDGIEGLKPRHRGRPGSRYSEDFNARVVALVTEKYEDFGPTLASEKLAERDGIQIPRETLRLLMIKHGIWLDRHARAPRIHQLRDPCERRGELVQIDGSHHRWFEDRGPKCVLLVFIDDATSEIGHLEFARSEDALAYMSATKQYIRKHGKPIAFYSDKHSVFYNSKANLSRTDGATQFGAVLQRLKITIICADSSQAKGRVERANRTLQDRLIKEMRLAGISTIEEANKFAPSYIDKHNSKFARLPFNPTDAHRPVQDEDQVDDIVRWEVTRKVTKSLSVHYNKVMFLLDDSPCARTAIGKLVTVCDFPDGRIEIRHEGVPLPYRTYDKMRRVNQAEVIDSKRISAALEMAKAMQEIQPHHRKRNADAPARKSQTNNLFPDYGVSPKGKPIEESSPSTSGVLEMRIVSPQLSLQYKNVRFVLMETPRTRELIGRQVGVCENSNGKVEIWHDGRSLPYRAMRKSKPVRNDRLASALAFAQGDRPVEWPQKNDEPPISSDGELAPCHATNQEGCPAEAGLVEAVLAQMGNSESRPERLPGRRRGRRPKNYVGPPTVEQDIDDLLARVATRRAERAA